MTIPEIKLPLETPNLIIDEFKTSDYNRLCEIAKNINLKADADNSKGYMPFYHFQVDKDTPKRDTVITQKASAFLIRSERERNEEPRAVYRLAMRLKDEGTLIGNVTINMLPEIGENGKLIFGDRGCCLDPDYGGRGYATEAVTAVSHEYFKYYDKMDITAHPNNAHSRKLITRTGGEEIGFRAASAYGDEPRVLYEIRCDKFYNSEAPKFIPPEPLKKALEKAKRVEKKYSYIIKLARE